MNRKLKILFLTPRFPYPVIGGDRLKPYMVLKHLGANHDVDLVTFNQGGHPSEEQVKAITKLGVRVHAIPLDAIKAGIRALPLTLFAGQPLEIAYYNQPEFGMMTDTLLKKHEYDIAFAFFMRTAEYIKDKPVKKVLMAEDCRTLYQKRSYEGTNNLKQKLVRWWEVKKLTKYEPEIMEKFDAATFVTEADIAQMKRINPNGSYRLLTNGTDIDKFKPNPEISRNGVLFAGKLDIHANELMVDRIVNSIMPIVWKELPDTKLTLAGANPSKRMLSMADDRINVFGNVPEMAPYLQEAQVFVHPHEGGSGIQNKLIEAMSCSCPVATTPTGTQGLPAKHEENIMIGQNDSEIAANITKILQNKELAEKIGVNARQAIVENLSWEAVYNQLDDIISDVST